MTPQEWADAPLPEAPRPPSPELVLVASPEELEKRFARVAPSQILTAPMDEGYTTARVPALQDFETRQAFEDFATDSGKWPRTVSKNLRGEYLLVQTATDWKVWQAAAEWERMRPHPVDTFLEPGDLLCREIANLSLEIRKIEEAGYPEDARHYCRINDRRHEALTELDTLRTAQAKGTN